MSKPDPWDYFSDDARTREKYWRYWCWHHARAAGKWATAFGCAVAIAAILAIRVLQTWGAS